MQNLSFVNLSSALLWCLAFFLWITPHPSFADDKSTLKCRKAIVNQIDFDTETVSLALENGEEPLDRVRIHFVSGSHDQNISLQVLADYANAMAILPDLKLDVIVSNDSDEQDHYHNHDGGGPIDVEAERRKRDLLIQGFLAEQRPDVVDRIRFIPAQFDLDYWAQDRSKPLSNGAALLSASKDRSKFSQFIAEHLYPEVFRVFVDLEGGNLVVGRRHIFSLSTLLSVNQLDATRFSRFFNKEMFFVDFGDWHAPHFEQNFHSDLTMAIAYRPALNREVIFLSSPIAAATAIRKIARPSPEAQKILQDMDRYVSYFARWDDHNRRLEAHLQRMGYEIRLVPGVSFPGVIRTDTGYVSAPVRAPLRYYNYVNAIFSGNHVLMPFIQVPELDSAARSVYESVGLEVIEMPSSRALLVKRGGIRCASYTGRKICEYR